MSTPYEQGSAALDELMAWAEANSSDVDRNEATTRLHLIDRLLTDVLGWPPEEIEAEPSLDGEYLDYRIGRPMVRMIVEAKREGKHFSIPAGSTSSIQKLRPLTEHKEGENLKDAASQVMRYCAKNGVSLAVVSNGTQLIAFLGSRTDSIPPLHGSALVFPSLSAMRTNFRQLWDNLSRFGVEDRNIYLTLREGEKATPPLPLSASLVGYPGSKRRNDLQISLEILAELFLEDVPRIHGIEEDFIQQTYATSGPLNQYALISRQILDSRYSLLHEDADFEITSASSKKGVNPSLSADTIASGLSKRPIILLGDVGVGKTMFIRHLIGVDAKDFFKEAITLYIDFGRQPALLSQLDDFVVTDVERQLLEKYDIDIQEASFVEAVHNGSLNRFDKGVVGKLKDIDPRAYATERVRFLSRMVEDRSAHLRACLHHLRGSQRKQVVIFLDNIDQREFDFQERVFLLSESLASDWPATVFVSLRPDTFYYSRSEGALTAYQPRVFSIAPPKVDVVLSKRLDFALRTLRNPEMSSQLGPNLRIESDSLTSYFEVLLQNFQSNEALKTLLTNLADGNMRRALDFVSAFIGSGHVDTSKILDIFETYGHYTIPLHEFLMAIIFGDGEYFDPQSSPIANIFDISEPDGREHFLASLLISFTETAGGRTPGSDGFVPTDELYSFGQKLGFGADQISWAINRCLKNDLLERVPRVSRDGASHVNVRVTAAGVYTVRILVGIFTYLDAVVVDTPIVEPTMRQLIHDARNLPDRLRRAEVFRFYLDRQWRKLGEAAEGAPFDWPHFSRKLAIQVEEVTEKVERAQAAGA